MKPTYRLLLGGSGGATPLADAALLILRILTGFAIAYFHGLAKVPPSPGFIEGVAGLGFPFPIVFAWAAGIAELIGGVLLVVGLLTRPASLFLLFTMGVAFFVRHAADPFLEKEKAYVYGAVFLFFLLVGAGRYSLDHFLGHRAGAPTVDRFARQRL